MRTVLTLEEIAERTRVPVATLRFWRSVGDEGPRTFRLGRKVVAFEDEVSAWVEAQAAASVPRAS